MNILQFLKDYWTQIVFFIGGAAGFIGIFNECKDKREISLYQLDAISLSYELYKKLKGNSFVEEIYNEIKTFKKI